MACGAGAMAVSVRDEETLAMHESKAKILEGPGERYKNAGTVVAPADPAAAPAVGEPKDDKAAPLPGQPDNA